MEFNPDLDLILDPLVVIDKDYNIVYSNESAKKTFGEPKGNVKCYAHIFGFEKPCWHYAGYVCPIKEGQNRGNQNKICTLTLSVNTKDGLKRKLVRQYKRGNFYVELYLPYQVVKDVLTTRVELFAYSDDIYLTKKELEDLISSLLKRKEKFFIIIINVKKLKYINEIYGIPAGDLVIRAVEQILGRLSTKHRFRFAQVAGGFFVLIPSMDFAQIENFEREVLKEFLSLDVKYLSSRIKPRITITTVEINPVHFKSVGDVYKLLLFAEKQRKQHAISHIFENQQGEFLDLLRKKEIAIRHLYKFLEERRITFYLQPIVSLSDGSISHFEVLMRFLDNGNVVSAGVYIDLIYELGLVAEFDSLLLDLLYEKLEDLARLKKPLFINVSDEDLRMLSYRRKLKKLLEVFAQKGIPISLEITEQLLFKEWGVIETLSKEYELKFVIDDFGTGYSSLKMVAEIVSKGLGSHIKIDCSLVKNYLTNRYIKAITDGVISFAKNTDLKTVGECIETSEQMEALKKAGLNYGQGWFFYKPMPLEEAIKLSS